MKSSFPGHFKENEKDLRQIWDSSLFIFDANILLNLYRYSDTTRNEFLRLLAKIKNRSWIPHRSAEEYLNNRLTVIDQQEKSYDETENLIRTLRRDLENARQHPFVSTSVMEKASSVFDELCDELKNNKSVHTNRISSDEIKDAIANIFEGRVGQPYDEDRLNKLITEGEDRYKQKIPPGFKDVSKSGDNDVLSERYRKYGDLIVWMQVIDKAIEMKKGVVFVTDDKKEDWWERFKGKTIGPRPELVKEFKDKSNQTFLMYQADRFLELARENLGEKVSDEIVEEIREVRRLDKLANKRLHETELSEVKNSQLIQLRQMMANIQAQTLHCQHELSELHHQRTLLDNDKSTIKDYWKQAINEDNVDDSQLSEYYSIAAKNRDEIEQRISAIQAQHFTLMQQKAQLQNNLAYYQQLTEDTGKPGGKSPIDWSM